MPKTVISVFGIDSALIQKWGFKQVETPRKVLGVFIGKDGNAATNLTSTGMIKKIDAVLNVENEVYFSKVRLLS